MTSKKFYGATSKAMAEVNALLNISGTGVEQDWEIEFADAEKMLEILRYLRRGVLSAEGVDALALL